MSRDVLTLLANHVAGLSWASQSGKPLVLDPAACATLAGELKQIRSDAARLLDAVRPVCGIPHPRLLVPRASTSAAVLADRSVQSADLCRLQDALAHFDRSR